VREHGLTDRREIRVETAGGGIVPRLDDDGEVSVDMGMPQFRPDAIPFIGGTGATVEPLDVEGSVVEILERQVDEVSAYCAALSADERATLTALLTRLADHNGLTSERGFFNPGRREGLKLSR